MKEKETVETLKCVLTEKETAVYGEYLAAVEQELDTVKKEESSAKSAFKASKDSKVKEIKRLSDILNNKSEMRDVNCKILYDVPAPMQCTIIRLDTGEELKKRAMTDEENQLGLDFYESDLKEEDDQRD
jgi:hypothetical protein